MSCHDFPAPSRTSQDAPPITSTLFLSTDDIRPRTFSESAALLSLTAILILIDGTDRLSATLTSHPLPPFLPIAAAISQFVTAFIALVIALSALILNLYSARLASFWASLHLLITLFALPIHAVAGVTMDNGYVLIADVLSAASTFSLRLAPSLTVLLFSARMQRDSNADTPLSRLGISARRVAIAFSLNLATTGAFALASASTVLIRNPTLFSAIPGAVGRLPLLSFFAALLLTVTGVADTLAAYSGDAVLLRAAVSAAPVIYLLVAANFALVQPALARAVGATPLRAGFDMNPSALAALLFVAVFVAPYYMVRLVEDAPPKRHQMEEGIVFLKPGAT